ncbi:hypothetical protein RF11_03562 [Thelohanellus kitauei]|uniref:Uncharacterized protein n=1 Tax=Thelohanellus kitauei TaxID=669202 RepID=A0A0C2J793_THEKT|nr:hypothetical protein RF11_03562 [Thelohanellus kitauei]
MTSLEGIIEDFQQMTLEDKYKDVFPCPGSHNMKCTCLEKYIQKKMSTASNHRFKNRDEVLDYLLGLRSESLRLSKELCVTENDHGRSTSYFDVPRARTRRIKSAMYIHYIERTHAMLKKEGICEYSCANILRYPKHMFRKRLMNFYDRKTSTIGIQSNSRMKNSIIPLEELKLIKCCNRRCSKVLIDDYRYFQNLRAQCLKSKESKIKAIKTLIHYSDTSSKICDKFKPANNYRFVTTYTSRNYSITISTFFTSISTTIYTTDTLYIPKYKSSTSFYVISEQ